ncbi:MAG TPA: GNAT family N-acetyltransferase [Anaerolineae bacterium]|nr:GNAT family N-acetyltransferase [Anaerolineae bacterium]
MRITLERVAANPWDFTHTVSDARGAQVTFRPLLPDDAARLAEFLTGLSSPTRAFCAYPGYDLATAQEMCAAIARYDKLRLVAVEKAGGIVALFELSFDLVPDDTQRYQSYGLPLDPATTCRFGPCVADDYQNRGLGSRLLPPTLDLARRFGCERVILWGGVMADNRRAIRYYERHGFQVQGHFTNPMGVMCYDMQRTLSDTLS